MSTPAKTPLVANGKRFEAESGSSLIVVSSSIKHMIPLEERLLNLCSKIASLLHSPFLVGMPKIGIEGADEVQEGRMWHVLSERRWSEN